MDLISRQAAIDTEGLDEQIRCEMCRNPMHTDRGCDGNCKYDEKLYESIMQILDGRMKPLPSAQQYTDEEIQKMQDMEQAQLDKAFKLGREDAQPEIMSDWKNDFKGYIEALDMPRDDYKGIIEYIDEVPSAQQEQKWIPFKSRPLTEEEKEDHPEWDFILDGKLPEDGQRILVNVKYRGHEAVQYDEYYDDGGCYLGSGYEIGTEVTAWMPLPKPYGGEPG